ncbi:hypothetical protein SAY86_027835 [Trapa natans]|uniref:Succinate dehydrogenase assembly factor 4, mitochondrial n=1 Tax=Trapa natans TaxID=22666 RepID=A0AAN7M1D3_TRANT|nr:hypothetical protein SAY86_027835 [Trapa natans]
MTSIKVMTLNLSRLLSVKLALPGIGSAHLAVAQPAGIRLFGSSDQEAMRSKGPEEDAVKESQSKIEDGEENRGDGEDEGDVHVNRETGEVGGPRGPEPTRYGDWEQKGRCSDF